MPAALLNLPILKREGLLVLYKGRWHLFRPLRIPLSFGKLLVNQAKSRLNYAAVKFAGSITMRPSYLLLFILSANYGIAKHLPRCDRG
jgi:hypothetical protein